MNLISILLLPPFCIFLALEFMKDHCSCILHVFNPYGFFVPSHFRGFFHSFSPLKKHSLSDLMPGFDSCLFDTDLSSYSSSSIGSDLLSGSSSSIDSDLISGFSLIDSDLN